MPANTDGPFYVVYGRSGSKYARHEFTTETAADAWAFGLKEAGWIVTRSRRLRLLDTKQVAA